MSKSDTLSDVVRRVEALVMTSQLGPNDYFSYTWDHGYETVVERHDGGGEVNYSGAHHPGDGLCHPNDSDKPSGDDGICVHCGRTLM